MASHLNLSKASDNILLTVFKYLILDFGTLWNHDNITVPPKATVLIDKLL